MEKENNLKIGKKIKIFKIIAAIAAGIFILFLILGYFNRPPKKAQMPSEKMLIEKQTKELEKLHKAAAQKIDENDIKAQLEGLEKLHESKKNSLEKVDDELDILDRFHSGYFGSKK